MLDKEVDNGGYPPRSIPLNMRKEIKQYLEGAIPESSMLRETSDTICILQNDRRCVRFVIEVDPNYFDFEGDDSSHSGPDNDGKQRAAWHGVLEQLRVLSPHWLRDSIVLIESSRAQHCLFIYVDLDSFTKLPTTSLQLCGPIKQYICRIFRWIAVIIFVWLTFECLAYMIEINPRTVDVGRSFKHSARTVARS